MFGVFLERNLFHHIPDADVIYEERTGRERERKVETGNQKHIQMQRVHWDRQKSEKRKSTEAMSMLGAPSIENAERVEIHLNEYKQKRKYRYK